MAIDQAGRSFLVGGDPGSTGFLVLGKDGGIWRTRYTMQNLEVPLEGAGEVALDWHDRKFFALGSSAVAHSVRKEHADIFWFDQRSREFRPLLPGTGGEYVDFSRDARWITYFNSLERCLYVSRADGSHARRVVVSRGTIQLPRWSPDGNRIAFTEQVANRPWRVFVISLDGGAPEEASKGEDSQGAPTWSVDGRTLAYGGVECQEMKTCAVHTIDLTNGQESIVPGS